MKDLRLQVCKEEHLSLLAELNKQLIEDEQHDNPMSIEQLRERMRGFLVEEYHAYLFIEQTHVRGYALVNQIRQPFYLRHFFICRDSRRQGYGRLAFTKLIEQLNTGQMDLEVLFANKAGYHFWKSLGFQERSVYMRVEGRPGQV